MESRLPFIHLDLFGFPLFPFFQGFSGVVVTPLHRFLPEGNKVMRTGAVQEKPDRAWLEEGL
jgi:hypothetical protein